jgi:hypothetical protein
VIPHVISTLRCVFKAIILARTTKVISCKMHRNVVNSWVNRTWQRYLKYEDDGSLRAGVTYQNCVYTVTPFYEL